MSESQAGYCEGKRGEERHGIAGEFGKNREKGSHLEL